MASLYRLDLECETFFRRGLPVLDRERDLKRASYCLERILRRQGNRVFQKDLWFTMVHPYK